MTLQQEFVRTRGSPVLIDGQRVVQMDRLPIGSGRVIIKILAVHPEVGCGIALKSQKGFIRLSDDSKVPLVHVWAEPHLPRTIVHRVHCPDNELRVWNLYRVKHPNGMVTEDAWTGNAGMIVTELTSPLHRRYRCSIGPGAFDPSAFAFEISVMPE